jgi:plastocyanin
MKAASILALLAFSLPTGVAAAPAPATVHIHNFAFVPASVTIPVGGSVRFVNDDEEPHTATAFDQSFDSKGLDTNDSYQHTFTRAGTVAYFCTMHPMMRGTIVVKP